MFREVFLCVTIFFFLQNCSANNGYFWKDFDGAIPDYAFQAGEDILGGVYIGQGFVLGRGIYPGTLRAGNVSLNVYAHEHVHLNHSIKILCSHGDLKWVTTKQPLPQNLTSQAIIGGNNFEYPAEGSRGNLYIIKVDKDGLSHIGYIHNNYTVIAFNNTLYNGFDTFSILIHDNL